MSKASDVGGKVGAGLQGMQASYAEGAGDRKAVRSVGKVSETEAKEILTAGARAFNAIGLQICRITIAIEFARVLQWCIIRCSDDRVHEGRGRGRPPPP